MCVGAVIESTAVDRDASIGLTIDNNNPFRAWFVDAQHATHIRFVFLAFTLAFLSSLYSHCIPQQISHRFASHS